MTARLRDAPTTMPRPVPPAPRLLHRLVRRLVYAASHLGLSRHLSRTQGSAGARDHATPLCALEPYHAGPASVTLPARSASVVGADERRQPRIPMEHQYSLQPAQPNPSVRPLRLPGVRRTPRISCEAVPASILPARARGGTSVQTVVGGPPGAAESFVSLIRLLGGSLALEAYSASGYHTMRDTSHAPLG